MASGAGIDEAAASSAGVIQSGTGRHELRWLQDPQIMEGERANEFHGIQWKLSNLIFSDLIHHAIVFCV
mgnify:CR=1 FL=1